MALWVPPKVRKQDAENTAAFAAAVRSATFEDAICLKWNRELERLDPLLRLVKNRSDDCWVVGTPLVPGAYHLLNAGRHGGPMTIIPIVDGEGRPLPEPPGHLLEQLKSMDLQNPAVTRRMRQQIEERAAAQEREKLLRREQRVHNIEEDWRAVSETSISMNDSAPWSQNVQGRKGAKKKAD